ncbi:early-response-to-dehydration protein [Ectocarpus siliculosus]|uniref:Early-response-to-dehydration protein n=1 Tax=Ectocarpus siliculosus TaxID=2880 RepID=D7FTY9_ECTSI|nr:early-response-to-dehydration protein [Ectocarpus siliculosus]|eukprot:CBJ31516.1 early-response-to-dehydration protein [Ectocarpus siliculosus]
MVGMDHYVLLRHCLMGFKLTALPALLGIVLMVLVYRTGGNGEVNFNEITMANVTKGSTRLWYSVAFMYIVVLWTLLLWWKEWENFVPKRFKFLAEGDPDMNKEVAFSTMVENIPEDKRSSPALYGYFDHLFPGKVSYASLCMHSSDLEATLGKKQEALEKVEHAVAQRHLEPPKETMTRVGGVACCGGEKVSSEAHFKGELARLLGEADKEHSRISQVASQGAGSSVASSTGFVAFTSAATKLAAAGLSLSGKLNNMDAHNAPAPNDVIWDNVTATALFVEGRKKIANCVWMAGILFWAIPVAVVLAISDLDALKQRWDWIPLPSPSSFLYGLIAGLLPVIALAVLTAIVPIVIRLVAIKFCRMKSEADVDLYVFKWHFGFRVANLWLLIIGGSIINQLDPFIEDPASIIDLLGVSVPGKAQFFLNTLIVSLLAGLAMDLSRIIPLIIKTILGALANDVGKSDRELRNAQAAPSLNWGVFYPQLLFVLLIVFCYAAIAPIVLPTASLLYLGSYLVYKNQALYVYVQTAESGGGSMYLLFSFSMACLYIGEVVFLAYIGIKEGAYETIAAVVLIFITIFWHMHVNKKFVEMSKVQCLEAAVAADNKLLKATAAQGPSSSADHPFEGKAYVQSSLKKSEWETTPEGYRDPANASKLPGSEMDNRVVEEIAGAALNA